MSWDESWPQPSPEALDLIERIYRLSNALSAMGINPGAARVAQFVTLEEAFILLDHLQGPWRMAVWAPSPRAGMNVETVHFDLSVSPQPGLRWGILFGITLIVEVQEGGDMPTD